MPLDLDINDIAFIDFQSSKYSSSMRLFAWESPGDNQNTKTSIDIRHAIYNPGERIGAGIDNILKLCIYPVR